MTKIKCKISDLQDICRLLSLKGKSLIGKEYRALTECIFNAGTNGITVNAIDAGRMLAVELKYKLEVLEVGSIAIGDLQQFEKFLDRFNANDEITFYKDKNKIVIDRAEPPKIAKIPELNAENSVDTTVIPKLECSETGFYTGGKVKYNLAIEFNSEDIKSIIDDGEVVQQRIIPWKISGGKLSVSIGSETYGNFSTDIKFLGMTSDPQNVGIQSTTSSFANGIDNVFSTLTGKVTVYIADGVECSPIIVKQKTDKYEFLAIIAPWVESK